MSSLSLSQIYNLSGSQKQCIFKKLFDHTTGISSGEIGDVLGGGGERQDREIQLNCYHLAGGRKTQRMPDLSGWLHHGRGHLLALN